MPYRRLPNTDLARVRAVEAALEKGKRIPVSSLAFSWRTLERLQSFYPRLMAAIRQLERAKQNQFSKSLEYGEVVKRARLYLSHFIQVLNMAIIREELKPEARFFYGLDLNPKNLPVMNLEEEIFDWGQKIIGGEQTRCKKGGNPIYSPSIALVKVHYDYFVEAYRGQQSMETAISRAASQMVQIREDADHLIQLTWNEVEATFSYLPEDQARENAASYGVVYVYRPAERQSYVESQLF